MRHARKLAFAFGAGVVALTLYVVTQVTGWAA
jgi:hypothetical protein